LWEDNAYENGESIAENIKKLIKQVEPQIVFDIAIEARAKQKLRHVPLLIAREMARLETHKGLVGKLLPQIIKRVDELAEFMAIYWKDGKQPLSKQVKIGLSKAFHNFDEYQFAKWNRDKQIKLRDVMFLVHPDPGQKEDLFKKIAENELQTPDTWEVALSAAKHAPNWEREIEELMLRGFIKAPKLPGYTKFVVDVSGSMGGRISRKSDFKRLDAASAMALIASETFEHISIYATAGNDNTRVHKTEKIRPRKGFALCDEIKAVASRLGGGGIFTRQCLEYIKKQETEKPDRIIIFSDSQDCDYRDKRVPQPFGIKNYIVDVSSNSHGINYAGVWTSEISGWSEHFLDYIFAYEGLSIIQAEEN